MAEPLWTSQTIAAATGGRAAGADFVASGVSIDTRSLEAGDLFIALAAERDGHVFVPAALAAGAAGVLAARPAAAPAVIVADTTSALTALAEAARDRASEARRGAVTGSVGKTTVTQMVRAALMLAGDGHGSVRSYNNHIGVPLTLARMPRQTRRAVFEIGMNHAGEITPLSRLVAPHVVAVTNVEAAHVEHFADGEAGVAAAKAEILAGLRPGGEAILNADNRWFGRLAAAARETGAKVRSFGLAAGADARLTRFEPTSAGAVVEASVDGEQIAYGLRQSAPHLGPMSLCAMLMMSALGVELSTAADALADFGPLEGRGQERRISAGAGAFTLIDESYNASPVSVTAAIHALGARPTTGRRVAVLTDMLELGAEGPGRHAALAKAIEAADVDLVFCAGPLMRLLWDALPRARRAEWAPSAGELAPCLARAVRPGDLVMIKGSHASGAALLVDTLTKLEAAA